MLVTIVTINYNNAKGLDRTVRSIVSQTNRDYEWIVIDGGSVDESIKILNDFKDCFSFWVSENDHGVYNAMNKGILHASGEYIIFMNSGDAFLHSDVLSDMVPYLNKDIVAGSVLVEGTKIRKSSPTDLTPWSILNYNIPHQAEFIHRSLFSSIGLYAEDLRILSDMEFNLQASLKGCSYRSVNYDIASIEQGGISCTQTDKIEQEHKCIRERNLPMAVCRDYLYWKGLKGKVEYPSINWAIQQKWPIKCLNLLYSFWGKIKK